MQSELLTPISSTFMAPGFTIGTHQTQPYCFPSVPLEGISELLPAPGGAGATGILFFLLAGNDFRVVHLVPSTVPNSAIRFDPQCHRIRALLDSALSSPPSVHDEMRATAITVAVCVGYLRTTSAAAVDDCPCGYADSNGAFTDIQETDFPTRGQDLIAVQNGWQIQEWSVPASPALWHPVRAEFNIGVQRRLRLILALDLIVHPEQDGSVSELSRTRDDSE